MCIRDRSTWESSKQILYTGLQVRSCLAHNRTPSSRTGRIRIQNFDTEIEMIRKDKEEEEGKEGEGQAGDATVDAASGGKEREQEARQGGTQEERVAYHCEANQAEEDYRVKAAITLRRPARVCFLILWTVVISAAFISIY
eukprot:TRINITY_DN4159_c0_g1_i1.p1 TRINITY_DN4159_c0_g1~~TRINITY_DN4159_c0_g1_i1.p1  ORF type:complete len:141 (+),score=9.17 TRINITY_DN4159_c0_g1_i1:66-488(+)